MLCTYVGSLVSNSGWERSWECSLSPGTCSNMDEMIDSWKEFRKVMIQKFVTSIHQSIQTFEDGYEILYMTMYMTMYIIWKTVYNPENYRKLSLFGCFHVHSEIMPWC